MKKLDVEQGSPEWHAARRCIVTGSKMDDVMGTSLARVQLIAKLIGEEATEQTKITRQSAEMERGNEEEEFAIQRFEKQTGKKVKRGGMWFSEENEWHGHSPDGSIESENGNGDIEEAVEVKNPDTHTMMFYRLTNMVGMEELGLGTWLKPTKDRPEPVFSPSAKEPFLGVPPDYKWQCVNYFLINPKLKRLYFLVHDARIIDEKQKLDIITLERGTPELEDAIMEAQAALVRFREQWMKWKDIILPTEF